ncbi:hypothetical protein VPHK567_0062 [Vibrio phage K567]|nr:hypothetical protein MYOV011v1_p0142 [Vibrio phage 6E35.1a]
MTANLTLTTATRFNDIMSRNDVDVKCTVIGSEYITSVYKDGAILAERIIEMKSAEHFEVTLPEPVREARKTSKLP